MSFCEHCQGQRFDRSRVLRALRELQKSVRATKGKAASEVVASAMRAVRGLDIPHLEVEDVVDEVVH
jgi:hypothetical protein